MCDRFPWKFDVQISYKPSNYVLGVIFVVNMKFPRATYHTILPLTKELYCLNSLLLPIKEEVRECTGRQTISAYIVLPQSFYLSVDRVVAYENLK